MDEQLILTVVGATLENATDRQPDHGGASKNSSDLCEG
jgi:hypothetical protein